MAIDQTDKRRNLARRAIETTPTFMNVLYELWALNEQRLSAGLMFVDEDFTGVEGLKHLDAATLTAAFDAIPQIVTAIRNANFDDVFEKLRR